MSVFVVPYCVDPRDSRSNTKEKRNSKAIIKLPDAEEPSDFQLRRHSTRAFILFDQEIAESRKVEVRSRQVYWFLYFGFDLSQFATLHSINYRQLGSKSIRYKTNDGFGLAKRLISIVLMSLMYCAVCTKMPFVNVYLHRHIVCFFTVNIGRKMLINSGAI